MVPQREPLAFELDGVAYRARRMDARIQFHVARRILPIIGPVGALTMPRVAAETGDIKAVIASIDWAQMVEPFINALGSMPDEPLDYVLASCLSTVERQQTNGSWARIWEPRSGRVMFDDLNSMRAMGQIVWEVLRGNLSDFFPESPPTSPDAGLPPQESS